MRAEYKKQWAQNNKAKCKIARDKYRAKAKTKKLFRDYQLSIPGKKSVLCISYRLRKLGKPDIKWEDYSKSDQMKLNTIYRNRDERNAISGTWEVDHIIPLKDGGLHTPDNLQVVTAQFNWEKH